MIDVPDAPDASTADRWAAPVAGAPLDAVVDVPGSKSLTNRYLVLAALADGPGRVRGALASRDTLLMAEALTRLGAVVRRPAGSVPRPSAGCPARPERRGPVPDRRPAPRAPGSGWSGTSIRARQRPRRAAPRRPARPTGQRSRRPGRPGRRSCLKATGAPVTRGSHRPGV